MFHSESEFIPVVLKACKAKGGTASFSEIREYVENHVKLTEQDQEEYPSQQFRYSQIIRNLKSNKTLVKKGLAKEVKNGFTLTPVGRAFA